MIQATPVAYSLFDDLSSTAAWRGLASRVRQPFARLAHGLRTVTARRREATEDEELAIESESMLENESLEEEKREVCVG